MLDVTDEYLDLFKAPSRHIKGSITYINNGNQYELAPDNNLKSFKIEKTSPNGKFFGFAVSQKITIEAIGIIDNIQKGDKLIPSVGIKEHDEDLLLPYFYVDTIEINKVNNTTTITGYDILHKADFINIGSLSFSYPMYISAYGRQVCEAFGAYGEFEESGLLLRQAPNFVGNESLREVLTALAETTGTICYVSQEDNIRFRTLRANLTDVLTADDYYNLSVGEITTLAKIASTTELGNNHTYGDEGFIQTLWENPFLTLLSESEITTIIDFIGSKVISLSNVDYNLDWRGCPAYEIGDYVILQDKEQNANYTYYLNETLEYNGGLKATSEWKAGDGDSDVKPSRIGQILNKTSAKVDKVNQEIELLASKVEELDPGNMTEEIASIKLTTESITQEVSNFTSAVNESIGILGNKVNNSITAEDATILVQETIGDGITSITTETGYKFDKDGLTISKSGSEMETTITEDGMTVARSGVDVLTADNVGVVAINLHATTYLIIGGTSRLEDYYDSVTGKQMTGCFWIGE